MKKDRHNITIPIVGLLDGKHHFDLQIEPKNPFFPENMDKEIEVRVKMEKLRQRYILTIDVQTEADFPCDRCLEIVSIPLKNTFSLLCSSSVQDLQQHGDDEEIKEIGIDDHAIDITEEVRDYLLLAIPLRKTCPEDAEGQPTCAIELPTELLDPEPKAAMWADLEKIRFTEDRNEKENS